MKITFDWLKDHLKTNLKEKDLNDMYLTGHNVQSLVEFNTYEGLEAQVKLTEWKKV